MVRPRSRWVRAAAVAILLSWLPCVPVGLCMAGPSEASARAVHEEEIRMSIDHHTEGSEPQE
jgi:hypothetical protein